MRVKLLGINNIKEKIVFVLSIIVITFLITQNSFQNSSLELLKEQNKEINQELDKLKSNYENNLKISISDKVVEYDYGTELYDLKRSIETLFLARNGQISIVNHEERERSIDLLNERGIELIEVSDLFGSPATILLPNDTIINKFHDGIEYELPSLSNIRVGISGSSHKDSKFFDARSYLRVISFQDKNIERNKRNEIYFEPLFMKYSDYLFTNTYFDGPSKGERNEMVQDLFYVELNDEVISVHIHRPLNIDERIMETIELLLKTFKPL